MATPATHSALFCADALIKGNRVLGELNGLCDSAQLREWHCAFNDLLAAMASGAFAGEDRVAALEAFAVRDVVSSMSAHRRSIAAALRAAQAPDTHASNDACSFAVLDWTRAAAGTLLPAAGLPALERSKAVLAIVDEGLLKLRGFLENLSSAFAEVATTPEASATVDTFLGAATSRLVRSALVTQALGGLFDGARLAAGARINNTAFGALRSPLSEDVVRAEEGRADAYSAMRLHAGLKLLLGILMLGAAKRLELDGVPRAEWQKAPHAAAVLAMNAGVTDVLRSYHEDKTSAARAAGRAYVAQTPGFTAAMQEQAAAIALKIQEPKSLLFDALATGLGACALFLVPRERDEPLTFWQAAALLSRQRLEAWTGHRDRRIAPLGHGILQVWGGLIMDGAREGEQSLVAPTEGLAKAAQQCFNMPVERCYGRDYAETERKVLARAAKEGRRPEELGEKFGWRLEWMHSIDTLEVRKPVQATPETIARADAALTSLAVAEGLAADGAEHALPVSGGNGIHVVHAVGMGMEPTQLLHAHRAHRLDEPFVFDRTDPQLAATLAGLEGQVLKRKQLFVEKVVERVAPPFKAWSGGALATDLYHEFFGEVWRRFNANLKHPGSPWADKVARWLAHYAAGTTPPSANGERKLIHPWKMMFLQKSVARQLLNERLGEAAVLRTATDATERAALRVERALLTRIIEVYDYAPWASHLIRRFCSMDEHKARKRRLADAADTNALPNMASTPQGAAALARPAPASTPSPPGSPCAPGLARPRAVPRWA